MAFWDQLKSRTSDMQDQLRTRSSQFRNKDFAGAAMAMCALIAAADGTIDSSERSKVAALITSNDVLSIFPASELRERFDHYCDKLTADFDFGKVEAVQALGKVRKKEDQARAVIQIGIIIGGADGTFDDAERAAVRQACQALGIPPGDFDL